jgi:HSP20 family protein
MTTNMEQKKQETLKESEHTRDRPVYLPATDIYETDGAVVVVADMPGVDEKNVDVDLDDDVLTLTGHTVPEPFEGVDLVCCGYRPGDYRRSFTLSDGVEREGIKAQLKNGVLRVTLPKAKKAEPRKIAVETASN